MPLANTAIDTFVRVDDEHVLALIEAVHGAHLDTVHVLAANAALVDDVGQLTSFRRIAVVNSFTMSAITVLARWLEMDAEKARVLWPDRNAEQSAFRG